MYKINIKPLSVNEAWKGRRFKSDSYKKYRRDVFLLLPNIEVPKGKLKLTIHVGFSSKGSDIDNIIKPFQDILQETYRFNDNMIYKLQATKEDVKKGEEFIDFKIESYEI